ncbi:ZmpA/ZmpB/ZmpC family metallo-endopeptidase-related protein [[Ruminococcus] torques]|uniref:ZmpA/ZmpB/ZmpC family metallo-endopeptidase-related protein n=1 Tax=[Ruminococcus] torques TaxID=33039 RepID=UPI0039F5BB69
MRGMNQKRKRLGLWILFLAALLLTQFTVPVKASEPQIQDVNIQMVGGQIRTIDPMGLRMVACIKKSYIQELEKSGATVSYGIVLLPKKYLTEGQALTLDGKYLYNGSVYKPAKVPAVKKFSEDNERIYFTAVLANLPKERYKNDYAARAYAEITRTVTEDDGKKKTTTEVVYSESEIDRQVYRIAEEAVNGTTETEETKQWLQDNILAPVDTPEELPEEEKKISFRLGKVSGVTLYHKTTSEAGVETVEEVSQFNLTEFKKEDYLVKVEMEDQPEIFAGITEVIAPQTETGKVSFKLDRKDYTTSQAGQTIEGAVVEFGTKSNDKVSTKYITMQSLIDQMKANPGGTYTLEHDIDASMVQGDDYLVPTFSGTFNGNGYKIKGLTTTLFGTVSGGKVQNVKLENVSITKVNSYKDAGGGTIANKAQKDAVIENVHVSGSLKSTNSRELLGGLVGRMDYAKVSKCSANLEITGSFNTTGGLIGQMSNQNEGPNIVENSYAVGSIRGNRTNGALGGLIGWHNCKTNFSVTNCYAAINMELTGTNRQPGGFIGYIGEADATGVLKSNVSYSTGNAGYKFDGSTETIKYTTAQIENLYSLRESRLKRESSRTGNTNLTQITDVTVDKLSQKEFYTNMGWSEDVWDFAPLKEGKTPILRNNDSNMTTMLQTKEIASAADLKNIKNDLSGVYVLTTDIDISESASGTAVIPGIFKGTLKGNGHQIIGQKIPLFDTLDGATIENVKLVQGEINQKGTDKVAALAKTSQADTLIKDVYVRDMSVTGQSNVAGLVASMNKTTVEECSVNATVNGKRAGGFAAEILGDSVVKNSYARRTADKETFAATEGDLQGGFAAVIKKSELINNFSELTLSQKAEEKPEEIPKKSSEKAAKTACMVGNFVAESGVGSEAVTKAEHNISFGPKEYSFAGNSTAENVLTNYTENYEYTGSVSNDEGTQTPEHTGKIDKATAAQITNKTFYIDTLKWDEKIWYLDDVAGGKRPRLKAEGDVYGAEEEDTSKGEGSEGDSNNAPSEEVVYIQAPVQDEETEEPQMAGETPTEVISFIAQKNAEEIAAMDSLESVKDYQADRKLIYENLRLFMPFYTYEQIVKDGNKVDPSHVLNKKTVLAVYPMDDRGNRIVALSDKTVQDIKKIRIQFTDETTPLIYNITYIDTRENIASYKVAQIPVHFNFRNYVVSTTTTQFNKLLTAAKGYDFDGDIETRVSQKDSASVLSVYRKNYNNVVKSEMEQVLISMAASNPQYPVNTTNKAAELMVEENLIANGYLKDFLYAYNYIDRWYDFQIGGINIRDVVLFDNSILKSGKSPRNLVAEIVQLSSSGGRQGNSTPSFYINRISQYTGISNVASFVEYFMTAYAGYTDVNDWIIDNFQGGFIVEARANNPKIDSRLWRILKNNTVQRNNELILPVLSYKTSKNLYLASFPTSLVYGNLQIYNGYQNTDEWRQQKKQQVINQINDFKTSYDNFVDVAENGAQSINKSKFLIVDSSANKDHSQDVFQEFYKPLQTMWKSNNGAVAVIFGNPNYDYIYYNSSNFIGDLTVLNHEMGHVTDMWIWMENKGKRPGRNGEDYSNGYANQANVDYNMNFMKTYARDGSMVTNLTPDRINTQEEFKSYYKEVFETIYTLDYLQGKAYLELTPAQQSAITSQHRYGTTNNYQSRNQSNSTWRTIGAAELENMNLKTLDDLWDNQLTIRPGHRFDLRSMNDVGVNNLGAYQIDRVCYASWYVPYVDGGTPNAQTFRRNGYELGGLYGYSDGLVEYLSNRTQTGDLAYFKKKMQDENFSFETYRKNKNKEIEEKIKKQKEQGNAYFDEEALIEYLKQNMINYGNGINSGVSTGNNTLNNIKESRENVFRYLQRITDEFRSPVYADTAESRHAVTISTGQELIEKINENPNGFYVLEKDISMADINLTGEVYIDKTFIGKLQGNGHKITDAQGPLFAKIANSYVSDLMIVNTEGETKDWFGKTKQYTIIVNEQKKETVQEIKTLEELQTVGQNKYTKYVLKNDIDASTATTGKAVAEGVFKGEFDGGGFTIKGLKKPLFEKVQEGTVRNLKIENAEINSTEESSKNAVITKESNHAVFESLNLADIKVSGVSYNAVVTGYDYISSVFSKIQIRNAQITGTKNYNAVLAGRASGSQIQDVAVIGSSVALSGTDCGGFIGEGKNVTISRVYSDADMTVNTYTDDKNRTQSAGFIGNLTGKSSVEYVFAAGKVDNKTSEQLYNFIGTPDALKTMVKNSFVIQNAGGVSNITDGVGQEILREATSQEAATSDFYKTSMTLNEETWNLSLVPMKGYPELKGMEKREVISVKTAEDFMKMKDFPTQEYRLKADIDLSGTEQTGSVIPEFSGVLDGENHKITGLKAPLFGQLSGTVSNVALDGSTIDESAAVGNTISGNTTDESTTNGSTTDESAAVGIFANTMTNATVEKVMIANGSISSTAGKAAGFAGTVTDSTVKNIFIQGRVNAVSTASGFAETSHHSVMENIYANAAVNGTDGAGFLVNSTGENSYKNICSIGNVAENMYKLAKTDITFTNAYELSAADGISSAAEANGVKTIGKEVWTKAFYTETLKLDISVWDVENAETNGYPLLKEFNVNLSPMTVEIQKPQDIRKLNKLPEGRFTITADLDFTEYGAAEITENIAENSIENNADINAADSVENSAENHAEETAQAGTCLVTETFTGSINGGGHKVSGMKSAMFKQLSGKVENLEFRNILVDNETAGANVLAETTHNANVKNVHFNGITLRGAGYTGMIGKDTGSTFSQISVQNADVTTRADYAGVFAANAAGTQIFDVLITDTEVATSNAYVGGFIGNAERITAQKVFADAELNIPYTVSPQNTAAFIGQASEDSKIQYSTAAGGVYPEDPSSTRYKLTHMDNSSNLNELKAFTNCFINTDTPGYDSIANDPKGVTHEALCGTEFYTNEMRLSQDVWDLSDVAGTGTPSLKTMPEEDVRAPETAPTPEEEIPMQETAPEGYTEIRTAEELLAIRDSSDKYILMSSISLYDAEPQDGSFLGNFKGELNGNGLTIREVYGAPLFNTLSGKVENLKLTDVKVEAWSQNQGANAFAKTLSGATVSKVALKNILVAGGNNTGALAGTAQNSTVSEVWAEGLNVNPYGPIHGQNDAMVGGLIAKLKGGCHISDSYVGGEITVNGNTQGGVFGYNSEYEGGATNNTVKQVVSNMKTKAISGQTDGAGFIGMVGYNDVGKWMENSIAIGEASVNREHGSIGEAYRFTSTIGYSMREGLENCYEAKVGGKSNISPGDLDETSRYKEKSFYQDTLKFDSSKWSFTSVEQKGHPTLSWIAGAEPLPPLPEGSAVTTHKQLKTEVPQGYTAIRTPADFMKIAENPSGKYILMNNISLEQVKLAEGQTSYIMKRFEGELDGNNQVIHGLRASLFDSISGTSSKKAVVKNLRVQNVFVNAGYKDQWGNIVRAEANGLAREVSNGRLETIYMNCVNLNGGSNTAALAGMADKTYIGKVWLEEVDINSGVSAEELGKFYYVGGVIGRLTDSTSKFEDSYAEGKIIMDSGQQGGVIGELQSATVRNVISNMEASGNPLQPWMKKGGFLGDVALYGQNNNKWKLDRCISIGNAGNNYKFLGKDISADTTTNLNTCYEFLGATGVTSVTDATIEKGILLATDNIKDITLYQDTLSFNDDTDGADSTAWDFSSVAEKGYPTLTWLLTYDGAAATMVEQTPVQDQEQEAAQDENLAEPEVNLPDQDEYLKED